MKSTTGPTFTNGIATNCHVTDTRAISMKGTFTLSGDKLNGAEVQIAAVVLVNGDVLDIGYSNFTFQSKGNYVYVIYHHDRIEQSNLKVIGIWPVPMPKWTAIV